MKHWYRGIVSITVQNRENKLSPDTANCNQSPEWHGSLLEPLDGKLALFLGTLGHLRLGHPNAKDGLNGRQEEQHHVKVLRCNAELGDRLGRPKGRQHSDIRLVVQLRGNAIENQPSRNSQELPTSLEVDRDSRIAVPNKLPYHSKRNHKTG